MANYDYLIVGQGIAGTMLTHFLLKKGQSVLVADLYRPSSSSNVAAGLCNPITGRRLVKTWKADTIFPFAESTCREIEQLLGNKFWHRMNIVRQFSGNDEISLLNIRSGDPEYMEYIVSGHPDFKFPGSVEITGSGYLDMAKLVMSYREKLKQENILDESFFRNEDLKVESDVISWKGKCFRKMIFCEGYQAVNNPFFSWLPFVLVKGEILTIYSKNLQSDKILSKGIFVLPLGNSQYKVGSTYQWDMLDEIPTEEGKNELVRKLERMTDCSYTIMDHRAGIRPAVKDRRPLIGMHPEYHNIGIFNGMGTKGATLSPFFASHFVEFLEEVKPLDKEVDIARFYRKHK